MNTNKICYGKTYTALELISGDAAMYKTIISSTGYEQLEQNVNDSVAQLAFNKLIDIESIDIDLLIEYYNDELDVNKKGVIHELR